MDRNPMKFISTHRQEAIIWAVLILGIYMVVIRTFGPEMRLVPGGIGDARFNNFVLEHFFKWVSGQEINFWNAPIFYPYPKTIAFSDSLLGSAPFYAIFRWFGFSRETAFQGWYVLGFLFNYLAAAYVLSKLKLHPLASSAGAFFFTFGMPMLAQNGHAQLVYRFGVPLACYFLWNFMQQPRLSTLTLTGFWTVWQFYLSIYMGFFLTLLLTAFLLLLPLYDYDKIISQYFVFWPQKIKDAWFNATNNQRAANITGLIMLIPALFILINPYLWVSDHYEFFRTWEETATMLPRIQSYFLADRSQLWQSASPIFSILPMRHEHQLFAGGAVTFLILTGILWQTTHKNRRFAFCNLLAFGMLAVITLNFENRSLYEFLYPLPGFDSIRAVTRIILVMMWPLAIFIAYVLDQLIESPNAQFSSKNLAYLCFSLLVIESIMFTQPTYSKIDARIRLNELRNQLPNDINNESILFFATNGNEAWWATEIDAMLLGQETGLPILNGYSGNLPPGYGPTVSCERMQGRIAGYLKLTGKVSEQNYTELAKRVVPIGFSDCDPMLFRSLP